MGMTIFMRKSELEALVLKSILSAISLMKRRLEPNNEAAHVKNDCFLQETYL